MRIKRSFPWRERLLETLKLILTQFNDETLTISGLILIVLMMTLICYWFYNRRKYHQLIHQIPASVVKNYLDSVIQNSTALKSSLFRGGGLELGEGIPSVIPVSKLSGGGVEVSSEVLNQKNAEIALLQSKLLEKDRVIRDLESQLSQLQSSSGDKGEFLKEISSLKEQLQAANSRSGGASDQVQSLIKEKEELIVKLQEYEIIEDDLANLKKLQVENEELKKKLSVAGQGGAPVAAPAPAPKPTPIVAPIPVPEAEASPEAMLPINEGEEKSAEDLLSEFEKMLE